MMRARRMTTRPFVGQESTRDYLSTLLKKFAQQGWSGALLFYGPAHIGKTTLAMQWMRSVLCLRREDQESACGHCVSCKAWRADTHPDAVIVSEEEKERSIGIEEVRRLQHRMHLQPGLAHFRVGLLLGADRLTVEAANALLKILEEPPDNTVLILTADSLERLPETLRSRTQEIAFRPVPQEKLYRYLKGETDDDALALMVSSLASGRPGIALHFLDHAEAYEAYQEEVRRCLALLEAPLGLRLAAARSAPGGGKNTERVRVQTAALFEIWEWVLRDLLLLRTRCQEFLTHRFCSAQLAAQSDRFTPEHLARMLRLTGTLRTQLRQYSNPALLLDYFLLQL